MRRPRFRGHLLEFKPNREDEERWWWIDADNRIMVEVLRTDAGPPLLERWRARLKVSVDGYKRRTSIEVFASRRCAALAKLDLAVRRLAAALHFGLRC